MGYKHKNIIINTLLLIISCIYSLVCFSQIFDNDQYPPDIKWRQINTQNFQLIFPVEFEENAHQLALTLERMLCRVSETLDKQPRKISIILQNQTVESNGFVQLAPRRSEFFTTPPQRNDFQDWLDQLAVHELRHVIQMDKLTGYLRAPFFEQLAFAIYGVTLPAWFFEGDAVATETVLTSSGRGRLPSWEMPLRTNLLSGRTFSYQKDYLGSLKDITPGYYELGYFMVTKMQRDHGPDILDSLMTRMARNPVRPYNFSSSLRKFTGYNTQQWHRETLTELAAIWEAQQAQIQPENYRVFPDNPSGKPASWLLPHPLSGGRYLALYRSWQQVSTIVVVDSSGRQQQLIKTGRQTEPNFSYAAGKVAWDEVRRHGRYAKRTYNIINIYDLSTKKYRQLTRKSRLFSPALNPDGTQLVAIEVAENNQVSVVHLCTESGQEIARFPAPGEMMLRTPAFDSTGTKVVMAGITQQGAALVELDLTTRMFDRLTDWQAQQIERPVYAGGSIVFKAHYNGVDNIYAFHTQNQAIQQLTHVKFGAFNPFFDDEANVLWFNNYQRDGYRISRLPQESWRNENIEKTRNSHISYFEPVLRNESFSASQDSSHMAIAASAPFNELKNIVNFHSLSVDNGNFESLHSINPGLYWLSDNLLNTAQLRLGYTYDGDIRGSEYMASFAYQRFLPKIDLQYRNRAQVGAMRAPDNDDTPIALRWREHVATLRTTIPLVFYRLNDVYSTGLSTATSYTWRYALNEPQLENRFIDHIRFPMSYQFYLNRNQRLGTLDLAPRWGQNLSITYRHLPFDPRTVGDIFSLRTALYFPGLWKNHSTLLQFAYQRGSGVYLIANDIPLVSGYDQLQPVPVDNILLFSYRFPVAYPDWAVGPLAYVKRIKGGVFFDFQNVRRGNAFKPRTLGLEFRTDMNFLRFYLPNFDLGVKLVYANEPGARRRIFATYGIGYSY